MPNRMAKGRKHILAGAGCVHNDHKGQCKASKKVYGKIPLHDNDALKRMNKRAVRFQAIDFQFIDVEKQGAVHNMFPIFARAR
jgi:hypothetical protein